MINLASKTSVISVACLLFVLATGGLLLYSHQDRKNNTVSTQGSSSVAVLSNPAAKAIPLGGEASQPSSDTNALRVTDQPSSSNPAAVGSGNNSATSSQNSSNNSPVPKPQDFSQYGQYKNDQAALYGDIKVGNGAEVVAGKKVAISYKGWLTDGKMFDQSTDKPFVFTAGSGQVVTGFDQAIIGMKVGGIRRMILPPAVAYGAKGQDSIPSDSVLIFDVQLLEVQ